MAHAFEWGNLLKCHLKGKTCRKWADGLKVGNSEKKIGPQGLVCPHPGAIYFRVPTGTGKHGKWLKIIPCMEKSWNLKNDEISWNNHGILL